MTVDQGIPVDKNNNHQTAPERIDAVNKTSSACEGTKKRSAGLFDEEACADEDDEEDD